jgi:hypothetical protein
MSRHVQYGYHDDPVVCQAEKHRERETTNQRPPRITMHPPKAHRRTLNFIDAARHLCEKALPEAKTLRFVP